MNVKAVVFVSEDQIEVREVQIPAIKPDQIRTETLYTFVSPGTELRTLAGFYGAKGHYPFIPGYSTLARVVEVGSEVKGIQVGDLLSSRKEGQLVSAVSNWFGGQIGGHVYTPAETVILPEEAAEDPLPYTVTEVASISYRGVSCTAPQSGENVAVIGQGMIGTFSAEFFRLHGCNVTVCDIDENRIAQARKNGFACVDLKETDALERMILYSGASGFDVISECSGTSDGFHFACKLIRKNPFLQHPRRVREQFPCLLLQASYVENVSIRPEAFFLGEGVKIITPADRSIYDRMNVVELIRSGKWVPSNYLKNIFKPGEFVDAYRKLQRKEICSAVFDWQE